MSFPLFVRKQNISCDRLHNHYFHWDWKIASNLLDFQSQSETFLFKTIWKSRVICLIQVVHIWKETSQGKVGKLDWRKRKLWPWMKSDGTCSILISSNITKEERAKDTLLQNIKYFPIRLNVSSMFLNDQWSMINGHSLFPIIIRFLISTFSSSVARTMYPCYVTIDMFEVWNIRPGYFS